jgi:hypothetical protein
MIIFLGQDPVFKCKCQDELQENKKRKLNQHKLTMSPLTANGLSTVGSPKGFSSKPDIFDASQSQPTIVV